jgi:hypothetical protein
MTDNRSSINGGTKKGNATDLVIIAGALVFIGLMLHMILSW